MRGGAHTSSSQAVRLQPIARSKSASLSTLSAVRCTRTPESSAVLPFNLLPALLAGGTRVRRDAHLSAQWLFIYLSTCEITQRKLSFAFPPHLLHAATNKTRRPMV